MSEHYILPGELAALMTFVFVPPLLLALVGHLIFLRGSFRQVALAFGVTLVASLLLGVSAVLFASSAFPTWLGIRDVHVAGSHWPVMPLAFIVVALVAPLAVATVARNAKRA